MFPHKLLYLRCDHYYARWLHCSQLELGQPVAGYEEFLSEQNSFTFCFVFIVVVLTWRESHIINPLLTKLVRSRWLDIGLVFFFLLFYKRKKELGQYPAILTKQAWSITHMYTLVKRDNVEESFYLVWSLDNYQLIWRQRLVSNHPHKYQRNKL